MESGSGLYGRTVPQETFLFGLVVSVDIFAQVRQRIVDHVDEIAATGHGAAEAADDIAFCTILGHHQHLAIGLEAVGGALDQGIGGLSAGGKNDLHRAGGFVFGLGAAVAPAVKKNGHRCTAGVLILGKQVNERIPGSLRMARRTLRQLRPLVEQRITVNQDANQRHTLNMTGKTGVCAYTGPPQVWKPALAHRGWWPMVVANMSVKI